MRSSIIIALASVLLLGIIPQKQKFSGKWKLDKKASSTLPSSFRGVDSYLMTVRQTPDSLTVVVELKGGGQDVTFPLAEYQLNGKESFRQDTLRGSKHWSACSWSGDGKKLTIKNRVIQTPAMTKREQRYRQSDSWELLGANTLRILITQKFSEPDSVHNERRVFQRVP